MNCELVCTGWYAGDEPRTYQTHGDGFIRGRNFRPLWWRSMDEFVKPKTVLVVDSASPVKPDDTLYTNTHIVSLELLSNPGHAQNCTGHYCGAMAAILLGMEYAMHADVDFYLYIEQDALLYGKKIIDVIKDRIRKADLLFGQGEGDGEIQQSVFAVSKRSLRKFVSELHRLDFTDQQISPEMKFMYAASPLSALPLLGLASWDRDPIVRRIFSKILRKVVNSISRYEVLPFGYGRSRPINFSDSEFYFQQASLSEVEQYGRLVGFQINRAE